MLRNGKNLRHKGCQNWVISALCKQLKTLISSRHNGKFCYFPRLRPLLFKILRCYCNERSLQTVIYRLKIIIIQDFFFKSIAGNAKHWKVMLYIGGFVQSFVHNAFDYDGQNYGVKMQCKRKMPLRILSQRCFLPFLSICDNIFCQRIYRWAIVQPIVCVLLFLALYTLCRMGLLFFSYSVHNSWVLCHGSSNKLQSQ